MTSRASPPGGRGRLRDPLGLERLGATVYNLYEKAFASVEEWRNRPLDRAYPYVYVDGIYLKRYWGGATRTWP